MCVRDEVITMDELEGFSEDLIDAVNMLLKWNFFCGNAGIKSIFEFGSLLGVVLRKESILFQIAGDNNKFVFYM